MRDRADKILLQLHLTLQVMKLILQPQGFRPLEQRGKQTGRNGSQHDMLIFIQRPPKADKDRSPSDMISLTQGETKQISLMQAIIGGSLWAGIPQKKLALFEDLPGKIF